ncbi:MAG: hypothetical protein US62_C0036G0021 [Candidatus Woesebacteria bacterium GW2011_GWA1_37_8]|uniref:VIT family protein n=1 Tax=Candidatus Woesebacteria bacterium GW2011_GWA1_37_8 TaxID=1618546 RepID=A0A0G0HZB9_9BACT|nr:MAG: hypothetical protein US62_C0036G0021 [Candidatus Woesebacteria bacterium GW2011_GWA1_37_8]
MKVDVHEEGSYIRDAIFAASDGLVTTFAVVAGAYGASLPPSVVIIMGFANLFADGVSMSSGTYLGVKSEIDYEKSEGKKYLKDGSAIKQGIITFFAFVGAGFLPITPYVFDFPNKFIFSLMIVFVSMFLVGTVRAKFTKKGYLESGFETLFIGGFAAVVAFGIGFLIERFVIQ